MVLSADSIALPPDNSRPALPSATQPRWERMRGHDASDTQVVQEFAKLCEELELAENAKDPVKKIRAESALRHFYAQASEEEQAIFRAYLEESEQGASVADAMRVKFHERMARLAALPLTTTAALLSVSVPAMTKISGAAARLASGVLFSAVRGMYRGYTDVFSKN